jgi:hypothetical protein
MGDCLFWAVTRKQKHLVTLKRTEVFELIYSVVKFKRKFGQKIDWSTFWDIFSQTHVVTLLLEKGNSNLRSSISQTVVSSIIT